VPSNKVPESHVAILESARVAMVSTIRHKDGLISTNPVGFDWDGEHVRISTLKSRVKYRNLLANPLITFCALDPNMGTRYIEIRGRAEISEDPTAALARKLFGQQDGTSFKLDEPGAERVVVKIIAEQVSTPTLYGGKLDRPAQG